MSNRKLLIADDSVTIQKVIKLTFSEEGYEVLTAPDGASAMELLRAERPDIVMADVNMPGPDGYEICRAIRSDIDAHATPVVLLAGSFEPFDEQMASAVGASASVTKSFQSIRQLVHQVNELVESNSAALGSKTEALTEDDGQNHSDIESLYHRSIGETPVSDETVEFEFSDQGLDDEMIETSYSRSELETVRENGEAESLPSFSIEESSSEQLNAVDYGSLPPVSQDESVNSDQQLTEGNGEGRTVEWMFDASRSTGDTAETVEFGTEDLLNDVEPDRFAGGAVEPEERLVPVSDGFEFEPVIPSKTDAYSLNREESAYADELPTPDLNLLTETAELPKQEDASWSDLDLLEIPAFGQVDQPIRFTTEREAADLGSKERVVALSDELVDLIATKLAEKLHRPV